MTDLDPHEPVALYEGPRLVAFRGWPLVAVVVVACLLGVGLDRALLAARDELARRAAAAALAATPPAGPSRDGKIGAAILFGEDEGIAVKLPPSRVTLVHVWLESCADCMTAFEAIGRLREDPALVGIPTINVAYGRATRSFAQRYGVDRSLVFDIDGRAVVAPLGIGSFTTLLVAPDGTILHRDRPDRDGFVQRVQAAYGAAHAFETSTR